MQDHSYPLPGATARNLACGPFGLRLGCAIVTVMRGVWVAAAAIVICAASACGADISQRVKSKAARDFACNEADTHIVEATEGVYRIAGCGMVAGYQCSEQANLSTSCEQLYVSKAAGEEAPKTESDSSLAKTN
jgi:hypothetical protein